MICFISIYATVRRNLDKFSKTFMNPGALKSKPLEEDMRAFGWLEGKYMHIIKLKAGP